MSNPKRQHWVPRFYLRKFATAGSQASKRQQVWICSNRDEDNDPTVVSVDNVAAENFLYSPLRADGSRDFSVEEKLSKLEGLLSLRWDAVADDFVDLGDEGILKKVIAAFLGTLVMRHPDARFQADRLYRRIVAHYDAFPKDALGRPDIREIKLNGRAHKVDNADWDAFQSASPETSQAIFAENIHPGSLEIMKVLLAKRWSIIVADEPVFVTSDRPVACYHATKRRCPVGTPDADITFALSPTRMLLLDDRHWAPANRYYRLQGGPETFNLISLWNAYRFVISHDEPLAILSKAVDWGQCEAYHVQMDSPLWRGPAIGRNERCPCGSGKKFKKCYGTSR